MDADVQGILEGPNHQSTSSAHLHWLVALQFLIVFFSQELESFTDEASRILSFEITENDFDNLLKVMTVLSQIELRAQETEGMFEPLKAEADLLKSYGEDFDAKVYLQVSWLQTRKRTPMALRLLSVLRAAGKVEQSEKIGANHGSDNRTDPNLSKGPDRPSSHFVGRKNEKLSKNVSPESGTYLANFSKHFGSINFVFQFFNATCEDPYERIDRSNRQLNQLRFDLQELKESTAVFNMTQPESTSLEKCIRESRSLKVSIRTFA